MSPLGEASPTAGYLPALFLESASKQYIDTLFSPTEKTKILFQAQTDRTSYLFANANANRDEEPDKAIWMTSTSSSGYGASFIAFGTYSITTNKFDGVYPYDKNIYGIKNGTVTYGGIERTIGTVKPFSGGPTITIFRHRRDVSSYVIRYWWCNIWEDNKPVREFVPMLDKTGKPCMYDKVTKEPYYNINTTATDFAVGMTVEQARRLGSLPRGGGKLTVSLPATIVDGETVLDAAVQAALDVAASKGWDITIQTYTEA